MERKRIQCYNWGVQIADCRYRPLDQTFDEYNPRKVGQTEADYHIHSSAGWTDARVKQFRKNIRRTNICTRHGFPFYSPEFERKQLKSEHAKRLKRFGSLKEKEEYLQSHNIDYWFPGRITEPTDIAAQSKPIIQTSLDEFSTHV